MNSVVDYMDKVKAVNARYDECWEMLVARCPNILIKIPNKPALRIKDPTELESKFKKAAGVARSNILIPALSYIDLNSYFVETGLDHILNNTIPHELAHIVQKVLYPRAKQAHGPEWKRIMRHVFNVEPSTYHSMDVAGLYESGVIRTRKKNRHVYTCECTEHLITKQRHNKVLNGHRYSCRQCRTRIVDTGKTKTIT